MSTDERVYAILGKKPGDFSTDRGGRCGLPQMRRDDFDAQDFAAERGEYWADVERGN